MDLLTGPEDHKLLTRTQFRLINSNPARPSLGIHYDVFPSPSALETRDPSFMLPWAMSVHVPYMIVGLPRDSQLRGHRKIISSHDSTDTKPN